MPKTPIKLVIPDSAWTESATADLEEGEDPRARLMCSLEFLGSMFHVDAIEVRKTKEELWEPVISDLDDAFYYLKEAAGLELQDQFMQVTIRGRQYVVFIHPYQLE